MKTRKILTSALCVALLASPIPTFASNEVTQAYSTCLVTNTSEKERLDLMLWVFSAMASHPEAKKAFEINDAVIDRAISNAGATLTNVLLKCRNEAKAVLDAGLSIGTGFDALGYQAMSELSNNAATRAKMASIGEHMDLSVLKASTP